MSFIENGLKITVSPPEGEEITPHSSSITRVNITNDQHQLGVRLGISLNLKAEIKSWCKKRHHSITVGYRKSQEVEFIWDIPLEAVAGTYYYHLSVEFLRSTSFYSVKPKVRQLTILPTIATPQVSNVEPIFAVAPASSSTQPIVLSSEETLDLEIDVHNRSDKTDNFRISTDLESAWYKIQYPETIKKIGIIDGDSALNLNPREKGKINLQITPPSEAIAGSYKPEIELHSLNSPNLFLKKIVYLNIKSEYLLSVELNNVLNRTALHKGLYNILLTNQGNTFRKLEFRVRSSDENECCEYSLAKSLITIPPHKTVENKLEVQPNLKQKKSFIKNKEYNFRIDIIDKNNYPLPKNLPLESILIWRSRPLWQLILLLLLVAGVLGVGIWGIRRLLFPVYSEPRIGFEQKKLEYAYGKTIALEWNIENYQNISTVKLFDKALGGEGINTQCYLLDKEPSSKNCVSITPEKQPDNCQIDKEVVSCSNVSFPHAKAVKDYTFNLQATTKQGDTLDQETKVSILPKPTFKIFDPLKVSATEYKPEEANSLSFEASKIDNLVGEDKIFLLINDERQAEPSITPQNVGEVCTKSAGDRYLCTVDIPQLAVGEYAIGIELQSDSDGRKNREPKQFTFPKKILVKTPIVLNYFRINNSDSGTLQVEPNTSVTVSWSVTGNNAKLNLDCVSEQLGLQGTKILNVAEGEIQSCTLNVLDESERTIINKTLRVKVAEPESSEESKPEEETKPKKNS